ncbi:hypothetical protein SG34_006195 [Thalassomonas viridans]|uniref:PsbP C-terminal domain-containing protein n=1 Tax=Thalassomonas viridans TaxID=137584 RepID=A0AAF0C8J4_9GAMM|nr:hypothetical protein [Thalassomonas viridans]WDE06507.1 hypothetical protein SG34_006195 [Thalassomonas viridans]
MKKFICAGSLAAALFVSVFLFNEGDPDTAAREPLMASTMKFASFVSGGSNATQKAEESPVKTRHLRVTFTHQEKLSDFVKLSPSKEWQPVTVANGVAIANYLLYTDKQSYQLAIIRMKKVMPLEAIMNIWQQKAGLPAADHFEVVKTIKCGDDQELDLYQIRGESQSIALAVHAGEKYTFFRLSGAGLMEEQVLAKFTELLSSALFI